MCVCECKCTCVCKCVRTHTYTYTYTQRGHNVVCSERRAFVSTHTHTLSLSHTNTHTHGLPPSQTGKGTTRYGAPRASVSTHAHTHTHAHTRTLSLIKHNRLGGVGFTKLIYLDCFVVLSVFPSPMLSFSSPLTSKATHHNARTVFEVY